MTYDLGFKKGVTEYWESHQDETLVSMDKKFGVHETTIGGWIKNKANNIVEVRGSGNYSSDVAKENARLKKELTDGMM